MAEQTVIRGPRRRPVGADTFADITNVPVVVESISADSVTFDGVLTPEQAKAVKARMTSTGNADRLERAKLREADGATNLAEMVRDYVLGDPVRDPIYPTT